MPRSRILISLLATFLLVPLMMGTGLLPARADVDIYTTPGTHEVNGREWRTQCEPYSRTSRCRTEIKATVVNQVGGRFVVTTGWAFNNLTYAASARSLWSGNPLAANGVVGGKVSWTANDGRKWRTECDTDATGRGGCRSYIQASVVDTYKTTRGATAYRWVTTQIFNNMVRFTPGSSTPVVYPKAPTMAKAPAFLQGRRHFTLGNVVTQNNSGGETRGIGRLSNIELDPGGKVGTFRERYWSYSFDTIAEKDWGMYRASIPTRPTGCASSSNESSDRSLLKLAPLPNGVCDVRTARTFLDNPTARTGTYAAVPGNDGNRIQLFWNNSGVTETYFDATVAGEAFSELRLTTQTHPNAVSTIGFMFGSTQPRGAGRTLQSQLTTPQWEPPRSVDPAQVNQSIFPYNAGGADQTLWYQRVGSSKLSSARQAFKFQDYIAANGGGCVVTPPSIRGRVVYGWHSYMCPLANDSKMVWHHMVSTLVAEGHGLCPAYVPGTSAKDHRARCDAKSPQTVNYSIPARAGGHVYEALQVVDDNNKLAGMIGLESSLYAQKASSQSQLSLFAALAADR